MSTSVRPRWALPRQFELARPFESVQREMDDVLNHFFPSGNGRAAFAPATLWEEENRWCVEVDLPGIKQEDIDITLEKNTLKLTAERRAPQEERKFWHQERSYGSIERVITLPETVDPEGIEAELKEGVLRLNLAKKPELQPKKIQVKASEVARASSR